MSRRLLVIANETVASPRVVEEVTRRLDADGQVRVVAPVIHRGRLDHFLTSGDAAARSAAEERLRRTMQALEERGLRPVGQLGDLNPRQALDDALRLFDADEVVIATHTPGRSVWLERGLVEGARRRHRVPVTHLVVDVDTGAAEVRPDPRTTEPRRAAARVPVFYSAPYEQALGIRQGGFRAVAERGTVTVSLDEPPDEAGVLFTVRVPAEAVADAAGGRVRVPVGVLDEHGPPVEAGAAHTE